MDFVKTDDCQFFRVDFFKGKQLDYSSGSVNLLLFCLEGLIRISSSLFSEEYIRSGEVFFLPHQTACFGEVLEDTHVMVHTFNNSICQSKECILHFLCVHQKNKNTQNINYCCKLSINKMICSFVNNVLVYLCGNVGDALLWRLKHKELIHLFCCYSSPEEVYAFFHPLNCEDTLFKSLVIAHYQNVRSTSELAILCGYGVENFRRLFIKEFHVPAYQWMQQKKAEQILFLLTVRDLSCKEVMVHFDFSSLQHFSRYCKNYLGDTPHQLKILFLSR